MTSGFVNTTFVPGVQGGGAASHRIRRGVHKRKAQEGGFPIAPLVAGATAAYQWGKKHKPASKAKDFLEKNVSEKGKKTLAYKIAHGAASVGKALGFGQHVPVVYVQKPKTHRKKRKTHKK